MGAHKELLSVFGDRALADVDSAIKEATADARLDGVHASWVLASQACASCEFP